MTHEHQPPDRRDDFDRGVANRRAVLGDEWVDRSLAGASEFNADFQSLITRYAWHDIWGRPGLDHETRRLLVLGMTMGMARWEEFELHCRAAVRGGVPIDKIKETLLQGAIYCGVPAANTAFKITGEILRAEGRAPAPRSLAVDSRVATHHTFSAPQLRVTVQGQGPTVVLSHALGLDLHMWDELAARLATTHTVLRYDQRGHGESARPAGPVLDRRPRRRRRAPDPRMGPGAGRLRRPVDGRHGRPGARRPPSGAAARRRPRQHRGALPGSGAADVGGADRGGRGGRHGRRRRCRRRALPPRRLSRRASAGRRRAAGAAAAHRRRPPTSPRCHAVANVDWLDRLATVRLPTLVLAGARDAGATPEMAKAIAERIAGAELRVFADASHLSVVEAGDEFHGAVSSFLASLPSR